MPCAASGGLWGALLVSTGTQQGHRATVTMTQSHLCHVSRHFLTVSHSLLLDLVTLYGKWGLEVIKCP